MTNREKKFPNSLGLFFHPSDRATVTRKPTKLLASLALEGDFTPREGERKKTPFSQGDPTDRRQPKIVSFLIFKTKVDNSFFLPFLIDLATQIDSFGLPTSLKIASITKFMMGIIMISEPKKGIVRFPWSFFLRYPQSSRPFHGHTFGLQRRLSLRGGLKNIKKSFDRPTDRPATVQRPYFFCRTIATRSLYEENRQKCFLGNISGIFPLLSMQTLPKVTMHTLYVRPKNTHMYVRRKPLEIPRLH